MADSHPCHRYLDARFSSSTEGGCQSVDSDVSCYVFDENSDIEVVGLANPSGA